MAVRALRHLLLTYDDRPLHLWHTHLVLTLATGTGSIGSIRGIRGGGMRGRLARRRLVGRVPHLDQLGQCAAPKRSVRGRVLHHAGQGLRGDGREGAQAELGARRHTCTHIHTS